MVPMPKYQAGNATVDIVPSLKGFQKKIAAELKSINPELVVDVDGNLKDFETKMKTATRLRKTVVDVDADIAKAQKKIADLEAKRGSTKIDVDAEISKAQARIAKLTERRNVIIQAEADTARAQAKIDALAAKERKIRFVADTSAAEAGLSRFQKKVAGIGGAIALAGPLVPGLAIGAGGALTALAGSAIGVAKALKDYGDASDEADTNVRKMAATTVSAAAGIRSAQNSVDDARKNAARVADSSAREISQAEKSVASAQKDSLAAQKAVNDERKQAAQDLADLTDKVNGYALSQKDANLSLLEAQQNLTEVNANATKTDLEKARAALQVEEAQARVTELNKQAAKDTASLTEAQKLGVEGSSRVISAKQAEVDANQKVVDAQQNLVYVQKQAAQQQADAATQISRALQTLTEQRAQETAALKGSTDAASKYATTLAKLSPAGKELVTNLIGMKDEANLFGKAMQQATLPGFTRFLQGLATAQGPLTEGFTAVGEAISNSADQANKLIKSPVFQGEIERSLKNSLPIVSATTDGVVGFIQKITEYSANNGQILTGTGNLITSVFGGVNKFLDGTADHAKGLGETYTSLGKIIETVLGSAGVIIGQFGDAFASIRGKVEKFVSDASAFLTKFSGGALKGLADGFGIVIDVADRFLKIITPLAGALGGFTGTIFSGLGAYKLLSGAIGGVATSLARINPTRVLENLSGSAVGKSIGKISSQVEEAGGNASKFSSSVASVGSKALNLVSVLPLAGVAVAGLAALIKNANPSIEEMATGLQKGGFAAQEATKHIEGQQAWIDYANSLGRVTLANGQVYNTSIQIPSVMSEIEAQTKKTRESMSELDLAQTDLTKAQNDLTFAQKTYGESSPQAAAAADGVAEASTRVATAQDRASEATKSHTEKMYDQQLQALKAAGGSAGYEAAQLSLERAQTAVAKATADGTLKTTEGKQALLDLKQAQLGAVASASEYAALTGDAGNAQEQFQLKTIGATLEIIRQAQAAGTQGAPAMQSLIKSLDDTSLAALGVTREVGLFGQSVLNIPANKDFTLSANVDQATKALDLFKRSAAETTLSLEVRATPGQKFLSSLTGHATGGLIAGPGTGTSDSIVAALSNGEFVVNAASTAKNLPLLAAINGNKFASGGLVGGSGTGSAATAASITFDPATFDGLTAASTALVDQLQALVTEINGEVDPAFVAMSATASATWTSMSNAANTSLNAHQNVFNNLISGFSNIRSALQYTSDWAVSQWARMREAAAEPVRWVINNPMNGGIIKAWNQLNTDFALGKPVNNIPIGFATGGYVSGPGTGTSDSINARLSNGEFVVKEQITKRVTPFLDALNSGQPEALQAAGYATGGLVDIHGQQVGSAVAAALKFAKEQDGKPYIWGGVGPNGYDCSGYMSAVTNVLRGDAPYKRLGVAASEPWAGFTPGLSSLFSMGASSVHTAGTLAGINLESTGTHVRFGGDAHGADDGQFNRQSSLPIAGGKFVSGGLGSFLSGSGLAEQAFSGVLQQALSAGSLYPGNRMADYAGGIAGQAVTSVQNSAANSLNSLLSGPSGGAGVEQWRGIVMQALARVGQDPSNANRTLRRMNQESGGNPRAINNWDVNAKNGVPSKGLMQVIDPTFRANRDPSLSGDIYDPLANIVASMRYALGRYGSLAAAYDKAGGYAAGGTVSSDTVPAWLTPGERVLTVDQNRMFEQFVSNLSAASRLVESNVSSQSSNQSYNMPITVYGQTDAQTLAREAARQIAFQSRNV